MDYRIYTLDVDDCATALHSLEGVDAAAALAAAKDLAGDHYAVELWCVDGPLVARLGGDVVGDDDAAGDED